MTTTASEPSKTDDSTVKLTIDGVEIEAEKGELLITAAQRAGIFIPRFCYHDHLKPVGMCRMCLVEIEGVRGLPPACTTPVADGMAVNFKKDNVEKVQEGVLEFLLINHPLDCPVCDRGGECPLQDQTLAFGPGESRFVEEKRHWEKPIEISDHVLLDRERCIQCSRCTRFADEIAGDPLITFVERGGHTEVNTFPNDEFVSYYSGNIVQICPVGALTAKPYRFNSRPWDLQGAETTCMGCSVGCKGEAQTSRNEMVRFLGIDSEPINQGWLCDKGRYGFDYIDSEIRVRTPFIVDDDQRENVSVAQVIQQTADVIKQALNDSGPESIAFLGGAQGTNEDAYAYARLFKGVIGTSLVDAQIGNSLPADLVLTANRARISDIDNAAAIISLDSNPKESHPLIFLRVRKAATQNNVPVINIGPYLKKLATKQIDTVPGDEKKVLPEILDAIDALDTSKSNGKIVLIVGDINKAQSRSSIVDLAQSLLAHKDVVLLPSVSPTNIIGAYEMGLAPGLLPGRVSDNTKEAIRLWPGLPKILGAHSTSDTESILKKAKDGEIKVLILAGSDPVSTFRDTELATQALQNVETVIAIDGFVNSSSKYANIFIPVVMGNEKDGTVTNIEGRVQRVVQSVAPQGNIEQDWKIALMLTESLGSFWDIETVEDITNEISQVAPSFAHLTTGILARARDGAIVPVDENKDVLLASHKPLAQTPSWEPIPSRAFVDDDPVEELEKEEHHPSANVKFAEMIVSAFERPVAHPIHLDQYALRLIFKPYFHSDSKRSTQSGALKSVIDNNYSDAIYVNPKDFENLQLNEENIVTVTVNNKSRQVKVISDKTVNRGVAVAKYSSTHPLRDVISIEDDVTDLKVGGETK